MQVTPTTTLPNGTKVYVNGKRGYVVDCLNLRDQFNSPINVHVIQYTEKFSHRSSAGHVYKPYDKIERANYASIQVI